MYYELVLIVFVCLMFLHVDNTLFVSFITAVLSFTIKGSNKY